MLSLGALVFNPLYIEKPWGGTELTGKLQIGEAFLISSMKGFETLADDYTIKEYIETQGEKFLGSDLHEKYDGKLPVYLKAINTDTNLSIQVHPDKKNAKLLEDAFFGKSEAWYILNAKKNAGIYLGLKKGVTKEKLKKSLNDGKDISDLLNFTKVKRGDFFYVPAGLVHAIGGGITLLEPQENSNTTYRLWDWDRKDEKGKPRELHIEKALEAINYDEYFNDIYSNKIIFDTEFECPIFDLRFEDIKKNGNYEFQCKGNLKMLAVEGGRVLVSTDGGKLTTLDPLRGALLPAYIENVLVSAKNNVRLIIITPR